MRSTLISFLVLFVSETTPAALVKNFVFFDLDRSRIHDRSFVENGAFAAAQLKYTWRELEPRRGIYDFRAISRDLKFLRSKGKGLFVQLQDVTFSPALVYVPDYLRSDKRYHGGANEQYDIVNNDETHAKRDGWVARRWDPAVRERFALLLARLGKRFDVRIEGINLAETAVDFGETGQLFPIGFTPSRYRDAILSNIRDLKRAFPKSVTMIYANFMPGEWLPDTNKHYLESVYACARRLKVGVGGPDMLPYKKTQMTHSYPMIRASHGLTRSGIAVQDGDYDSIDPRTGKSTSINDLINFATDYLRVDYIFWCTQEPYFSNKLIPFLKETGKHVGYAGVK
jgi:hypothetical protein